MTPLKVGAIVLIAIGVLALAVGTFTYTKDTHEATVGPLELSISEKETVNIPVWAGLGAIVMGGGLLFFAWKKS